jgi:hypothetical protein
LPKIDHLPKIDENKIERAPILTPRKDAKYLLEKYKKNPKIGVT